MGMICSIFALDEKELSRINNDSDALMEFFEKADDQIDLDKAWHAIHFLLTGSAWQGDFPLNFILSGGRVLQTSDEESERYFSPAEVSSINQALSHVTNEDLLNRYDAKKMTEADLYPSIWARPNEQEANRSYIAENFTSLKEFLIAQASRGKGMIVSIM